MQVQHDHSLYFVEQRKYIQSQQNSFCAVAQFVIIIAWTIATMNVIEFSTKTKQRKCWILAITIIIIPGLISIHGIWDIGIHNFSQKKYLYRQDTLISLLFSVIYTSVLISASIANIATVFVESKSFNLALIKIINPNHHGLILIFTIWICLALYFIKNIIKIHLESIKSKINSSKNSLLCHLAFYFIAFLLFFYQIKFSENKFIDYTSKLFGISLNYRTFFYFVKKKGQHSAESGITKKSSHEEFTKFFIYV